MCSRLTEVKRFVRVLPVFVWCNNVVFAGPVLRLKVIDIFVLFLSLLASSFAMNCSGAHEYQYRSL